MTTGMDELLLFHVSLISPFNMGGWFSPIAVCAHVAVKGASQALYNTSKVSPVPTCNIFSSPLAAVTGGKHFHNLLTSPGGLDHARQIISGRMGRPGYPSEWSYPYLPVIRHTSTISNPGVRADPQVNTLSPGFVE
jgi:hypothetical protein